MVEPAGQDAGLDFHGPHFPIQLGPMKFFNIGGRDLEGGGDLGVQEPVSRLNLLGGG